jgi:hypothetical protein
MQCPDCGAFVTTEDAFCGECGRPLGKGSSPAAKPLTPLEAKDLPTVDLRTASRPPTPPKTAPPSSQMRSSPKLILLVLGAAVLGVCVCGLGVLFWLGTQDQPAATPTQGAMLATYTEAVVATSPVESTPAVETLFEDNFDDPASGWDVWEETDTWAGYADGGYRLGVKVPDYVAWGTITPTMQLSDFIIEVEAQLLEGPVDNNYGLLVRYQDDGESFYWFEISSDGYYSVDLLQAGEWTTLVDWESTNAIQQGTGTTNRLKLICAGDQFVFYVNDVYLTEVKDSTFADGSVGLAAGDFDHGGVVVHFDNLKIYTVQE